MNIKEIKNIDQLLKNASQFVIFCDLDGVLVDLDKEFEKFGYGTPEECVEKYGKKAFWDLIKSTEHFWLNMEWMPDGKQLWDFVKEYNPTILTTPAKDSTDPHCVEDKKKWVEREIGDVEVIMSFNKAEHAKPNAILIDDMEKNIKPWETSGGIGILHVSAQESIKKLQKIIKNF